MTEMYDNRPTIIDWAREAAYAQVIEDLRRQREEVVLAIAVLEAIRRKAEPSSQAFSHEGRW